MGNINVVELKSTQQEIIEHYKKQGKLIDDLFVNSVISIAYSTETGKATLKAYAHGNFNTTGRANTILVKKIKCRITITYKLKSEVYRNKLI
jgi:hypothetical protein